MDFLKTNIKKEKGVCFALCRAGLIKNLTKKIKELRKCLRI